MRPSAQSSFPIFEISRTISVCASRKTSRRSRSPRWSATAAEPETEARLRGIAKTVFVQLGLETLVRRDLRAGPQGEICVLEANLKPDLKRPVGVKTSIVCVGLQREGTDYDDLILSLFADRLDLLLSQRRGAIGHLTALLDEP